MQKSSRADTSMLTYTHASSNVLPFCSAVFGGDPAGAGISADIPPCTKTRRLSLMATAACHERGGGDDPSMSSAPDLVAMGSSGTGGAIQSVHMGSHPWQAHKMTQKRREEHHVMLTRSSRCVSPCLPFLSRPPNTTAIPPST